MCWICLLGCLIDGRLVSIGCLGGVYCYVLCFFFFGFGLEERGGVRGRLLFCFFDILFLIFVYVFV